MSRHQFKLLVVVNQLLFIAAVVVAELTDRSAPGGDESVFGDAGGNLPPLSDLPFWVGMALIGTGLIAAIGLCLERKWGRVLYVGTFVLAILTIPLTEFYVDSWWTVLVSTLAGTTEGMIIALMYFSPVQRMFKTPSDPNEQLPWIGASF